MIRAAAITLGITLFAGCTMNAEPKGIIGKYTEDGRPVIVKFVDELPVAADRQSYSQLVVISWKYDSGARNGMPSEETNGKMQALEQALDPLLEVENLCRHAYSRTGNDLKELVYYTSDSEKFMEGLNGALASHPLYPIGIDFYDDPEWQDFRRLRSGFFGGD